MVGQEIYPAKHVPTLEHHNQLIVVSEQLKILGSVDSDALK